MSNPGAKRPAILGGTPIRSAGPPDWPRFDDQIQASFERLIQTGDWGRYHGPHGPELSHRLARYHNVDHLLLCSSGTSAVELALRGVGVSPGDEVILAGYDFKANFQNILCLGAVPVLIDLLPNTWQLDPDQIDIAITPKTRAIIASHLHGGFVEIPRIRQIVGSRPIQIIEDACQNPGAMIQGERAGTLGDVSVLSFGGSKLLTAGRGGAVLTRHSEIIERIKRYVNRGNEAYPLSEMQSAILIPQLLQLDDFNNQRLQAVQSLCQRLKGIPGLTILQPPTQDVLPAYYKLGLCYRTEEFGNLSRDQFATAMRAEGIPIDAGFRSLHLIHAARRFRAATQLDEATKADSGMLTLHHPILLEGKSAMDEIITAIELIQFHVAEISLSLNELH